MLDNEHMVLSDCVFLLALEFLKLNKTFKYHCEKWGQDKLFFTAILVFRLLSAILVPVKK